MNKVITVNVFQGITVYLLRLFMGAGAGLRRRQAKVQFASVEYETIKHVLSRFSLSQTSIFFFFLPRADVLAGSNGVARRCGLTALLFVSLFICVHSSHSSWQRVLQHGKTDSAQLKQTNK